jgi:hypothetical protein
MEDLPLGNILVVDRPHDAVSKHGTRAAMLRYLEGEVTA